MKDYSFIIDERNIFSQSVKNDISTSGNIWKLHTGQRDDYTTGCILNYSYFKQNWKLIAIDLSKKHALDVDLKAMQQINLLKSRTS